MDQRTLILPQGDSIASPSSPPNAACSTPLPPIAILHLASVGAWPITYKVQPCPTPSSSDSPWTLFLYKINKDVCKRSASAPFPHHTAACFAQQMLYLYKFFIAGLCKQAGEGEKGCFCTSVGGEGASFQGCAYATGWSPNPAGGQMRRVEGLARHLALRCWISCSSVCLCGGPSHFCQSHLLPGYPTLFLVTPVSDLRVHLRLSRLHLCRACPNFLESCSHSSPAPPSPLCHVPSVCPLPALAPHPSHGLLPSTGPTSFPAFTLAALPLVGSKLGVAGRVGLGGVGLGKSDFGA